MNTCASTQTYIYSFRSVYSVTGGSSSYGLWKACLTVLDASVCGNIDCPASSSSSSSSLSTTYGSSETCGKFMAARAFLTLTCILTPFIGAGFFLWAFLSERLPSVVLWILKISIFACLVLGIIGVAIGIAVTLKPYESSLTTTTVLTIGPGAIVGIIAIILNLIAGILGAIVR